MNIGRRLNELEKECKDLGLTVVSEGKKLGKKDFVRELQQYNLKKKYPDGNVPWYLKFMLAIESPMLCFRINDMDEEFKTTVWKDDSGYIAQDKINGVRILAFYDENDGMHFYSRNLSVSDYLPVEYKNIWLGDFNLEGLKKSGVGSFIIDSELLCPKANVNTMMSTLSKKGVITENNLTACTALLAMNDKDSLEVQKTQDIKLEFHMFHLLMLNGNSKMNTPWSEMVGDLNILINYLKSFNLSCESVPWTEEDKEEFYEEIVAKGGEGIVLKKKDSTYRPTESRYHRQWIKVKRSVSESLLSLSLGDTMDAFVIGWDRGKKGTGFENMVGSLKLGVYLNKKDGSQEIHHIANVSNIELEERKRITTVNEKGEIDLDPSYMGRVFECDGQSFSPRSHRLVHPRMIRPRPDRSPESCLFDEERMLSLVF